MTGRQLLGGPASRGSRPRPSGDVRDRDLLFSIWVAFGFAVAQPLFDLLGRGADFFVARRSPALDVLLLAAGLAVVAPLLAAVVVVAARRVRTRLGFALHAAVLGGLVALFALQVLKRVPLVRSLSGALLIVAAVAVGALSVAAFHRVRGVRSFFGYVSPAPVVFAALFLLASPVRAVAFPGSSGGHAAAASFRHPAPVVVVVFDEAPVSSLMDARGGIDRSLYPNFARLAREGTWFRNATTVHDHTTEAVPAMLSGRAPRRGSRLPILANHPDNLFTFASRAYDVRAFETYTQLCPRRTCKGSAVAQEPFLPRWRSLAADLRVAALHVFLPQDLTRDLPPVDETFGNFEGRDQPDGEPDGGRRPAGRLRNDFRETVAGREGLVRRFLASVGPTARPPLFYLHVLLPHRPFYYLPTGQKYACDSLVGRRGPGWGTDAWAVTHQYQRHLLQVGYADHILGRLFARLERAGLYDDALIVVASDHGMIFRPGVEHTRVLHPDTLPWVVPVPLFVKTPRQRRGGIDDRRVETIDVMPTIADVLGARLPWRADGRSVFSRRRSRTRSRVYSTSLRRWIEFGTAGREKLQVLDRKLRIFGRGLFRAAPDGHADLIGRGLGDLGVAGQADLAATLNQASMLRDVDPRARAVPACLSGRLRPAPARPADMAVALNGKVVAVTRTYERGRFAAVVPPGALRPGANDARLLLVSGRGARTLRTLRIR